MKFGLEVEGPGIAGICERVAERLKFAVSFEEENLRRGKVFCNVVFSDSRHGDLIRKELETELLSHGAVVCQVLFSDTTTGHQFIEREEYIALVRERLFQAQIDLNQQKAIRG